MLKRIIMQTMKTEDIQTILKKLRAYGLTDVAIGRAVGAPQSIITRLRNGNQKTTNFERGAALMELLAQMTMADMKNRKGRGRPRKKSA